MRSFTALVLLFMCFSGFSKVITHKDVKDRFIQFVLKKNPDKKLAFEDYEILEDRIEVRRNYDITNWIPFFWNRAEEFEGDFYVLKGIVKSKNNQLLKFKFNIWVEYDLVGTRDISSEALEGWLFKDEDGLPLEYFKYKMLVKFDDKDGFYHDDVVLTYVDRDDISIKVPVPELSRSPWHVWNEKERLY